MFSCKHVDIFLLSLCREFKPRMEKIVIDFNSIEIKRAPVHAPSGKENDRDGNIAIS